MKSIYKRVLLAALLAAAGVSGFAQGMGMGGMGGPMAGPHEGMPPGMHPRDPAKMQEMMTRRLSTLKAKLKISAEQEGAWAGGSDARGNEEDVPLVVGTGALPLM